MKKVLPLVLAASLAGCNFFSTVATLAPLVGQQLVNVGGAIVAAECSPQLAADGTILSNVIKIIAPDTNTATEAANVLSTNEAVAAQLCPLVNAVTTAVGTVPTGTVVATVPTTTPSVLPSFKKPLPITYLWK